MSDIKILGFYKDGVAAEVTEMRMDYATFSPAPELVQIGAKAKGKPRSKPAWDTLRYRGQSHLALNKGHVYKVTLGAPDESKTITIDSTKAHSLWPVPSDHTVDAVSHVEPKE